MIRTAFAVTLTIAYILLVGTPLLIYSLISGDPRPLYRTGVRGCRFAVRLAGVRLEVIGREKIPAGRAVVFMANHQSMCDPPALISVLPRIRVLLKKELFRIPILGRGMKISGFIAVDRANRERSMQAVDEAVAALKAGDSFLVYPEGTRTPDGRLLPFKKGAFVLAIKAQALIVPISLSGGTRILRKGQSTIRPGTLRITIHDPIETAGYAVEDRKEVIKLVRAAVIAGLAEEELPLAPEKAAEELRPLHGIASGGQHEILTLHGFTRSDVDGEFVLYEHPTQGTLHTFPDGSWKHVTREGREASGTGAEQLEQRLAEMESEEGSGELRKPH